MSQPLIVRYTSNWPSPFTPAGELVYNAPRRERQIIDGLHAQIEATKAGAREVVRSNLAAAQIIANELQQQTQMLQGLERTLEGAIRESVADVVGAIERVGNQICVSLDEIRWQIVQQRKTLDGILNVLLNRRNVEAQELVRQGVRLYANEKYEDAEERFRLALKKDKTDYQVLLNLAFIEIHKDHADTAEGYFKDALTLPDSLDDTAKRRGLWGLARLHYAERRYQDALDTANRALSLEQKPEAISLYTKSAYAALAGQADVSLHLLRSAIQAEPTLFGRAGVDPDLQSNRAAVLALLSELAYEAFDQAKGVLQSNEERLRLVISLPESAHCPDVIRTVQGAVGTVSAELEDASYLDLLRLHGRGTTIAGLLETTSRLVSVLEEKRRASEELLQSERAEKEAQLQYSELPSREPVRLPMWFLWHVVTSCVLFMLFASNERNMLLALSTNVYMVFGWIVWLIIRNAVSGWNEAAQKSHDKENAIRFGIRHKAELSAQALRNRVQYASELIAKLQREIAEGLKRV